MFIKVEEIGPDGLEIDEPLPAADILRGLGEGAAFSPAGDGRASVSAAWIGHDVLVRGVVSATLRAECSRCLAPVERHFDVPFTAMFARRAAPLVGSAGQEESGAGEDQEGEHQFFEGPLIELDDVVRDNLVLSLPMAPSCSPDCRGLCPSCGKSLNDGPCGCPGESIGSPLAAALKAKVASVSEENVKERPERSMKRGTPKTKKITRPPR